ncbi:MAG: radical SAM family RiPP maturation amino acid epimerase [Actinomycetota bacterium]
MNTDRIGAAEDIIPDDLWPTEPSASKVRSFANLKRWSEWWIASEGFRSAVRDDPLAPLAEAGIALDADESAAMRALAEGDHESFGELPESVEQYIDLVERIRPRSAGPPRASGDPRLSRWRRREFERCEIELGRMSAWKVTSSPVAIELAVGCTMNCWFCAVSAQPLEAVAKYDDEIELFDGIASTLRDVCGPTMRHGFLYWATDPFDNPDYERFAARFAEYAGAWPHTSTARAVQEPDRVRPLVACSRGENYRNLQVSILSEGALRRFHAAFTPEETLGVSVILHTPDSQAPVARAGFARSEQRARRRSRLVGVDDAYTPACVTGFMVNLPHRRVQLVAPCNPSDEWPGGVRVFDEATFDDADDFAAIIDTFIDRHAVRRLSADTPLDFRRLLTYHPALDGFDLMARSHTINLRSRPALDLIGALIANGDHPTLASVIDVAAARGHDREAVRATIDWLDEMAVFADQVPVMPPEQPVEIG